MEKLLAEFRPDVVHVHKAYPHLSVAPIIAARDARVPVVQTAHDYEFVSANPFDHTGATIDHHETRMRYRALNTALFEIRERVHAPAIDAWVTVSQAIADTYADHGLHAQAIPNFTLVGSHDVPRFHERDGVIYAGRLTADKGVDDVIALARAVPDLAVRIAGFGSLTQHVATAARRIPNLTFLGYLSDGAGGFSTELSIVADWDLWLSLAPHVRAQAMAEPLTGIVEHAGSMQVVEVARIEHELAVLAQRHAALLKRHGTTLPNDEMRLYLASKQWLEHRSMGTTAAYLGASWRAHGVRGTTVRLARRARARRAQAPGWITDALRSEGG